MEWLEPTTLRAPAVCLEPLSQTHHDDLVAATRDGELWKLWYTNIPEPEKMRALIDEHLALNSVGNMLPFAVRSTATGRVVGTTSFLNIEPANRRLEIGGTWYANSAQRTAINTQCKWLLLTHAFEKLDCIAVEFRTHYHNRQSRRAIERLGAKLDGVLRSHRVMADGSLRDTCVYSIVTSEWPTVRAFLHANLVSDV